jgi:hypothetical protein
MNPQCDGEAEKRLLRIDVVGHDENTWAKLRVKLIDAVHEFVDGAFEKRDASLREEGKDILAGLVKHLKATIAKPTLENAQIEAEIRKTFAETNTAMAEARKTNAEADAIEFKTKIAKLKFALRCTKALLIKDQGTEAIIFSQQVTELLECVKDLDEEE